jgi:hypothetical protein
VGRRAAEPGDPDPPPFPQHGAQADLVLPVTAVRRHTVIQSFGSERSPGARPTPDQPGCRMVSAPGHTDTVSVRPGVMTSPSI